jgi:queuine/archaeosine tRNA-ribosyltransferase
MRFFIPEWDDRVDPGYNFSTDTHSEFHKENPSHNDSYMWDIFGIENVPFDGVLVSVATLQQNRSKYQEILEKGIHKFLGLPQQFPLMADCGAFSYIKETIPPYKTEDILKIYSDLGFNYGVSIDHLVVPAFKEQNRERMQITYENGVEAYRIWKRKYRRDYQLIVAVQGAEIADYLQMYNHFLLRGIRHLAFGSLVRAPTPFISKLIDTLIDEITTTKVVPEYIHFFGVARSALFEKFQKLENLGIEVAFDSASYLRRAWLGAPTSQNNYITNDWNGYTAIRIPQNIPKKVCSTIDPKKYQSDARACLRNLKKYDNGDVSLDRLMKQLEHFNNLVGEPTDLTHYYKRVLEEKPWKKCDCPICKKIGIDVAIFRGNNRNRRRGFHNVHVFYNTLKDPTRWHLAMKREDAELNAVRSETSLDFLQNERNVLIITSCTKSKLGYDDTFSSRAQDMYQGDLFKKVKSYSKAMKFDYIIISAKYGVLHPAESINGYEMQLRTRLDVEKIRPEVEQKLRNILSSYDRIVVIAGENYRRVLVNLLDDRFVFLKTKGIGDLVSIVGRAIPDKNKKLNDF